MTPTKQPPGLSARFTALSAKRGETPKSKLQGASKEMYETMTEKELEDMASTKHDKIPERKG